MPKKGKKLTDSQSEIKNGIFHEDALKRANQIEREKKPGAKGNKNSTLEKKFFILEIDKVNKNFRKYTKDIVESWVNGIDEYGYDVEFGVGLKPSDIQYEYIKSEMVCGLLKGLTIEDNKLYGNVIFSPEAYKGKEIFEGQINLEECVIVPKGKAEVRDGVVQKNYTLYGFNIVYKSQSSFHYD